MRIAAIVLILSLVTVRGATINADSGSLADVTTAYNAAARGDTILVPADTETWASALTVSKGVRIRGAGIGSTVLTRGGVLFNITPDATAIANEEVIEISGFTLDGNDSAGNVITVTGAGTAAAKPWRNLIIATNLIRDTGTTTGGFASAIRTGGQVRGVIASNTFDRCNVILVTLGNDHTNEFTNAAFTFAYGTSDNLFFENNQIGWSTSGSWADPGWIESGQGARVVVRYNTWDNSSGNASMQELWDIHGFQNFSGGSGGQTGTMLVEYYGNTITGASSYRWINHRGNPGLFFNNILTGAGANAIEINQYADGDVGGSGCEADVAGNFLTSVRETYVFNNTDDGSIKNMVAGSPIGNGCGTAENASYWNYNSSFDGTAGVGRGTSAPGGTPTDGVAYWVASTATPTVDSSVIQAGTLYVASGGSWAAYYQPYDYPHPLVDGGGGGGGGSGGASDVNVTELRIGTIEVAP